ncbi:hypothetical protein CEXT_412661 [Caerostris extrusa]|uniref:Uncharacterized protein n=1 Tax=Caerostris extrusa TaxID=172846 RepID=A0AAV4N4L8_CAEEX|nr:hypothetical protein CEXT_412661 [Caerostris extrusa]
MQSLPHFTCVPTEAGNGLIYLCSPRATWLKSKRIYLLCRRLPPFFFFSFRFFSFLLRPCLLQPFWLAICLTCEITGSQKMMDAVTGCRSLWLVLMLFATGARCGVDGELIMKLVFSYLSA